MSKIEINNIYKIFGNNPDSVMDMVKGGSTKDEVLEQTGHTVGLDNVSLNIEEGETSLLNNCSTWIGITNKLVDLLESVQEKYIRLIMEVPMSTPRWHSGLKKD